MNKDFLLEIGTEELPPKQIGSYATSLAINLQQNLQENSLAFANLKTFFSPRRVAILISNLVTKQPDQPLELRGPPLTIAFDNSGEPTAAATKFAKSCGVEINQLTQIGDKKGKILFHQTIKIGKNTFQLLPEIILHSIKKIQVKRPMHWGENQGPFIRPIHWMVALLGEEIIPLEIFGIKTSNQTFGHRFHYPKPITISSPQQYEKILAEKGRVMVDFTKRRQKILDQITATTKNGTVMVSEDLLTEVTNLVEWPVALVGSFNPRFLQLPPEVIITTLETHQRYFPMVNTEGKLLPQFIIISNIESKLPQQVVAGNEKVIQARLNDAEYFYQNDLQLPLAGRLDQLKTITFQDGLGTLYDKTMRLKTLASFIATKIGEPRSYAEEAAHLSKCDLVTSMVVEFPELQGIMGYYYASSNESKKVAVALKEQYLPRFSKDNIPITETGSILALADRLDSLVGFFSINKEPSGDKDPFGLRRAASGILRIILEKNFPLDLKELLMKACSNFKAIRKTKKEVADKVLDFIYERLHNLYLEEEKNPTVFRAVLACKPTVLQDFTRRFEAVDNFIQLPEAVDLIEIFKRIRNILEKAKNAEKIKFDLTIAKEPAENNLATMVIAETKKVSKLYRQHKYFEILNSLVKLKKPLNNFFDNVMVMTEDKNLRENRLALLTQIHALFMLVGDLSYVVSGNKTTAF